MLSDRAVKKILQTPPWDLHHITFAHLLPPVTCYHHSFSGASEVHALYDCFFDDERSLKEKISCLSPLVLLLIMDTASFSGQE